MKGAETDQPLRGLKEVTELQWCRQNTNISPLFSCLLNSHVLFHSFGAARMCWPMRVTVPSGNAPEKTGGA